MQKELQQLLLITSYKLFIRRSTKYPYIENKNGNKNKNKHINHLIIIITIVIE